MLIFRPFPRVLLVLILLVSSGWSLAAPSQPTPLRYATVVLENRETVIREFSPLLARAEQNLGQPIHFVFYDKYDDILAAFARKEIDLAYLGPLPYTRLRERFAAAEPVVRFNEDDGTAMYRCVLVAFRGDAIRMSGLKGKKLGLTQPLSTCGPLSVNWLLRKHAGFGIEQTQQLMLNSHENVALATVGGEVSAGGVKESIAHKYAGLGLEVLARTEPLPGFALIANRATLGDERVERLRQHLLATPQTAYRQWGASIHHGMKHADDAEYGALRTLLSINLPSAPKRP